MAQISNPVDVVSIVSSIKEDIVKKYKAIELPAFEDVNLHEVLGAVDPSYKFDHEYFGLMHQAAAENEHLDYYHPLQGSSKAVFVKKVARKLARGVIEPLCERQTIHNTNMGIITRQLYLRTGEQQEQIDDLKRLIELQQIQIDQLKANGGAR